MYPALLANSALRRKRQDGIVSSAARQHSAREVTKIVGQLSLSTSHRKRDETVACNVSFLLPSASGQAQDNSVSCIPRQPVPGKEVTRKKSVFSVPGHHAKRRRYDKLFPSLYSTFAS